MSVRLHVRRFFCDESSCERVIFAERLPGVVAHYARRTERLEALFTHISFALGGEAGAKLLRKLGVRVSDDALLEHIRSLIETANNSRPCQCQPYLPKVVPFLEPNLFVRL